MTCFNSEVMGHVGGSIFPLCELVADSGGRVFSTLTTEVRRPLVARHKQHVTLSFGRRWKCADAKARLGRSFTFQQEPTDGVVTDKIRLCQEFRRYKSSMTSTMHTSISLPFSWSVRLTSLKGCRISQVDYQCVFNSRRNTIPYWMRCYSHIW